MLPLFQIIFVLFALLVISQVLKRKKSGHLSSLGMLFWILVWVGASVAVLWPDATQTLANYFGIGRGTDFVVYSALAIMFFGLFRLHIKIESMQRDITAVVRKKALKE